MDQSLGLIGAAILGALVANVFQIYRDSKKEERQKKDDKIRAISDLRGIKHTMLQSKASYYSAYFESEKRHSAAHIFAIRYIDYDSILSSRKLSSSHEMEEAQQYVYKVMDKELRKSLELKEYLRQKQRSEELQQGIAKNDERFWRIIGRINILFPNDKVEYIINDIKKADNELGMLEKEINESIVPIRNEIDSKIGSIKSNVERDKWTKDTAIKLHEWAYAKHETLKSRIELFDLKIDNLIDYLETEFDNCSRDCKFFCSSHKSPLNPSTQEREE
jgi:hypothetical protein